MLVVISLGGSIIVPDRIDEKFLYRFRKLITDFVKKGNKAVIVCGGGKICRDYINTARRLVKKADEAEMDRLGVKYTELNAELVRILLGKYAHKTVHSDYNKKIKFRYTLIAAGLIPGTSTDYDAVMFARNYGSDKVINISNIDYVYDKDPKKYNDAKPIDKISWKDFKKLVGNKWKAGLNLPFDPIASKKAQEFGLKVIIINGKNLDNLKNIFEGKKFKGTTIS